MKKWTELSEEELYTLTEEEIKNYENIICAENGVPIISKPKEPTEKFPSKDIEVFRIRGVETNLLLTSLDEANQLLSLLKSFKTLGVSNYVNGIVYYCNGTQRDYRNEPMDITMSSEQMLNSEKIMDYLKVKTLYENYDEELNKYNEINFRKTEVTEDFHKELSKARESMDRKIEYLRIFNETYLPIAEGNKDVAIKFMKAAYHISENDETYILSKSTEKVENV